VRVRRTSGPTLQRSYDDELALWPALIRRLQRNLADAGYYEAAIDGRLQAFKDVPAGAIVAGNPAKVIGRVGDVDCKAEPPLSATG
jgi:hypothetical protein